MNKFFKIAIEQAAGKKGRLLALAAQLARKARSVNWKDVKAAPVKEKFFALGRLLQAYATGRYRQIPWKTMVLVVAALIYFINPLDFIPDLLPLTGLTDDFAVLVYVYQSLGSEMDKFLTWEKSQVELK